MDLPWKVYASFSPGGRSAPGNTIMDTRLTIEELEARWEETMKATGMAASKHPRTYRELKAQAAGILEKTVDINDYFPTVEQLTHRLKTLDSEGQGSIFQIFNDRISPSSIWHVRMLRMECLDLLTHLKAFDEWRRNRHGLRMVK
jgi:hypothetical protein